ncbi:growth hormone secretagogue receptor type 1-like [Physella acuta]|uniref:growth hormone secretagogue receptor type 1-like n=1 Tax=Physella acuta TaxID=109671 RepID=UPI0027DC1399|nr:growth hormone secretagogue receptor type 1-like [Physella acuta]
MPKADVCPVALFLFGTIGNLLILLTLRNLRLGRSSMHLYLRALAISDLLVLYTGLLRQWLAWTFDVDLRDQHVILCKLHTWLLHVTLYTSSWLLVVMTLERSCSACFPHRVSSFCTKRRACLVILVIVASQLAIQSHFLIGLSLVPNPSNVTVCAASSTQYDFVVNTILPIADVVLLSLLPFLFVIVGNVVIVWRAFLSLKTAAELSLTFSKNVLQRKRRTSSMTIILIGLSAIFLLTTSPSCVYNLWELGGGDDSSVHGAARAELAWALVNILMYCNNTFNFYLYCLSGRKFRNEMRRQFSRPHTDSLSNAPSGVSVQMQRLAHSDVYNSSYSPLTYQTSLIARQSNAYL